MRKTMLLILLATLAVGLACPSVSPAITKKWSLNNLVNKVKGHVAPVWGIFEKGTARTVPWQTHPDNPRFQVYDPNGNSDPGSTATWTDDIVLDRETGLIWERSPYNGTYDWETAKHMCYGRLRGGRFGWRQPTIEEMTSLMDTPPGAPNDGLAEGHPFNIEMTRSYWSATTSPDSWTSAYAVFMEYPEERIYIAPKTSTYRTWCVRGGAGEDGW